MNVAQFVKWLERLPQHLEVCVVENSSHVVDGAFGYEDVISISSVCFDDPQMQARVTEMSVTLGIE